MLYEGFLIENDTVEQLLEKFDETLKSLRRQFRKLLKEKKAHKNCRLNVSEDSSITSTKTSDNSKGQDAIEFISEHKSISDDISMIECNNVVKKVTPNNLNDPKIVKDEQQDEISEILTVQFDTQSEQALLQQFELSKSKSKELEVQKSPVFNRTRFRGKKKSPKKSVSCQIFPTTEQEKKIQTPKEQLTENKKFDHENRVTNFNKSIFSSVKEEDNFISPKSKSNQKLRISNICNVNPKLFDKGNKLKQTKLVFTTDEEKIDISQRNKRNQLENSVSDSLFDSTLFNSNINENMDIDTSDTSFDSVAVNNVTTLSSTPKKIINLNKKDFDKISPTKENKRVQENEMKTQKKNSKANSKPFETQASVQFLSPRKKEISETKNMHNYNFDSDTEFNYDDNSLQKQNTTNRRKNLVGFLKKASVLKENSHKDYNQINKVKINETMVEDETFFSPGEYENDILNISTKPGSSREIFTSPKTKRLPNNSLVQIPEKKKRSPQYAYEDEPVRRKNERAKLDGWSCWDCKKYYQDLNLPENELKERLKQCSRHKYKYDPNYYTPPGFWNPGFPDTLCPTFQEPDKE